MFLVKILLLQVLKFVFALPYVPLLVVGLVLVSIKAVTLRLKLLVGIGCHRGSVGVIDQRQPFVHDITSVSTKQELKFIVRRSPLYILRMSFGTAEEIAKLVLNEQKVNLISNSELIYSLLNSVFAHSLVFDKDLNMYSLKMVGIENYSLFKDNYWDAREVLFTKDCKRMKIVLTGNQEVSWPCPDNEIANWRLAKLHAQVSLTFFGPGLSHNHVHFVFPSAMIHHARQTLPPKSFLWRLLEPHTQFTERLNFQALSISHASDNKQTTFDKFYAMWKSIPISGDQFVGGVTKKCQRYYNDPEKLEKHKNPDSPGARHPCFPPPFVNDEELQRIPYLRFLATYYKVVYNFVSSVAHRIEESHWKDLVGQLEKSVPGVSSERMVDVITTFIHQVGVIHYCDHYTFLYYYAQKFGCMTVHTPFTRWEESERWDELRGIVGNHSVDKLMNNPELMLKTSDIMKTRCFLKTFVEYIPDLIADLTLLGAKYDFDPKKEEDAVSAVARFKEELRETDVRLQSEESPLEVPVEDLGDREVLRGKNLQLIPASDFIASVCF